jgi:hypothetical protein
MLSLHEVATLILVKDAPDQTELVDQANLDALLEHRLVSLEGPVSDHRRFCITARGSSVLQAIARIR